MKIAVVMGGISSEREISIKSGSAILNSLVSQGYNAYPLILDKDNFINKLMENEYDLAYIALHGEFGEDGRVQGFLDILGKKYTGSDFRGSCISMDKNITKNLLHHYNIKMPKSFYKVEDVEKFPVVVKPSTEGSSVGLYICENKKELEKACKDLEGLSLTIEEFVKGEELTVGVLDGEALGVLKIKPKSGVYDYKSKYTSGETEYEYPAKIDGSVYEEAMEVSEKVHKELNLKGASRSDFILKGSELYFLEVNTSPGMTNTSLLPKLATLKGYNFDTLVKKIVDSVEK
jgi:D-alanine-D-alanine ligase